MSQQLEEHIYQQYSSNHTFWCYIGTQLNFDKIHLNLTCRSVWLKFEKLYNVYTKYNQTYPNFLHKQIGILKDFFTFSCFRSVSTLIKDADKDRRRRLPNRRHLCTMASSMYKLVQTINSTKFRTEPFEDYYDVFEEIGRWELSLRSKSFTRIISVF